jgi:hypothetical protein
MKRCSECGGLNEDDAVYCKLCGKELGTRLYGPSSPRVYRRGPPYRKAIAIVLLLTPTFWQSYQRLLLAWHFGWGFSVGDVVVISSMTMAVLVGAILLLRS